MGITIKINNDEYDFEIGETILEVARRNGIYIPTLCNLEGTKPTGACRICIVELGKMSAPVASCSTPAAPGMDIQTESPRIRKARKTIIELLMISGNHNCAAIGNSKTDMTDFMQEVNEYDGSGSICTAYGECELQSLAYKYMVSKRTLERIPTNYPLENDDPLIGRDFSRCILCGRCVQACTEVSVINAISHGYRGNVAKIVARGDKPLPDSECVYCGECLQVCPVGALYEKRSKYDQRVWDVKKEISTCYYCGIGCRLVVSIKNNKIIKIDGLDEGEPNSGQLCFKGRFGYDFLYNDKRLTKPMIRSGGKLKEASWKEAYSRIIEKIGEISGKYGSDSIGCVVSPKYSNEDLFMLKKFIEKVSGNTNIGHSEPYSKFQIEYSQIKEYEKIVLIGTDIARDNPVAANYIKQANLKGSEIIEINEKKTEISKYSGTKLKDLSEFKPDNKITYLVIYSPDYDISSLEGKNNISLNSITSENNTSGAYMVGIGNENFEDMKKKKMVFSVSSIPSNELNTEFLVVIDQFGGESVKNADVILPPAVWVENEGTYVNSQHQIYRMKKIIEPSGGIKSLRTIFGELLDLSGFEVKKSTPGYIWDEMIRKDLKLSDNFAYSKLKKGPVRIVNGFFKKIKLRSSGSKYDKFRTHKLLCNHCEGLSIIADKRINPGE